MTWEQDRRLCWVKTHTGFNSVKQGGDQCWRVRSELSLSSAGSRSFEVPLGGMRVQKIWTRGGPSSLWITHSPSRSGCNDGFRRRREKILSPKEKKQTNRKKNKKKLGIVSSLGIVGSWAGLQSAAAVTGTADETAVQLIGVRFERRSKRTPSFACILDVGLSSSPSAMCSYRTAVINSALRQSDSFPSSQAPAIYINWCFEKAEDHVPTLFHLDAASKILFSFFLFRTFSQLSWTNVWASVSTERSNKIKSF